MTEFFIKNILAEELFGNYICESIYDKQVIDYLYEELMLERLLYGEPVTIPELRALLRKKIVNFEFIKLNGEIRPAKGTTMMKYIPKNQHPKGIRPSSPKVATFYDLNKKEWRSVSEKSKEIVLKKDEEKDKPVIMVKDKPAEKDIAVGDKEKEEILKPDLKEPESKVYKVQPVKKTDETKTFYFINDKIGASKIEEMTPKDVIKELKKLGKDWRLATETEFKEQEEKFKKITKEKPEYKNIPKTVSKKEDIINKKENLENKKASEI